MVMIFSWELCYQGSMSPVAGWEQTCPDMKTITHTHVHTFSLTPPVCLWAEVFAYVSLEALHWCVRGSLWQILKYSQLTPSSSPPPPAWLLLFVQLSTCTRRPATPHKRVYMHLFFYHCVTTSRIASFFVSSIKICRWIIIHSRY